MNTSQTMTLSNGIIIYNSPLEKIALPYFNNNNSEDSYNLPDDFIPGSNHVVCARGKAFWDHSGNKRYRTIIAAATAKYAKATNKLIKGLIVSDIVDKINEQNDDGKENIQLSGFVKREKDPQTGKRRWMKVDDNMVRDKVGQSLRDSLHGKYRSSTKAKQCRRSKFKTKVDEDIQNVIHSNIGVSRRIERLSMDVRQVQQDTKTNNIDCMVDDESISTMFCLANLDILERLKKDTSLLSKFEHVNVSALDCCR